MSSVRPVRNVRGPRRNVAYRQDRLARWWVQLNCFVWPSDLPGKPTGNDAIFLKYYMAGAMAAVDALADQKLVDLLWRDKPEVARLTPDNQPFS